MARKPNPDIAVAEPVKKPPPFIHEPGWPERFCRNCDHFRGPQQPGKKGQCHNLISGIMFVTERDKACSNGFYPDTVRFPIHVLMGIVPAD